MALLDTLPPSLSATLSRYPAPGERNLWLFRVASQARHIASPERIRTFLHAIVRERGWLDRDFSPEIDRAIKRAFSGGQPSNSSPPTTDRRSPTSRTKFAWPPFNEQLYHAAIRSEPLFELEPLAISPTTILDHLFAPTDLLCLSLDIRSAITLPRKAWSGKEAAFQFLVANPMTAATGLTQDGRVSNRCHGNATQSRTYQVIEFDRGSFTEQCSIISSLHTDQTPLILVLWSGGKSLHGWFKVSELTEPEKQSFFAYACELGADSSLWDPCKLVRMPGGRRSNGHTQHVLDFQPQLLAS